MTADTLKDIERLETDLWAAADNLRANSKLTSSDYFMPVLGVIFLRHAANRFEVARQQIEEDQAKGKMPKRNVLPADYIARRSLFLPETARYDWLIDQAATRGADLPKLVTSAMTAIEKEFLPLKNVLPKDYGIFESKVLEDLLRLFNSEQIKQAKGDVFGRIYEYFLAEFSVQKAHDNGEFFTPSSIVQTIVNVIEPDHGTVFDPACGSGGMFVQTSHFIEQKGSDTAKKVVFYGQEKNRDTIRIARMNLAVHGLDGRIAEAITYYQDEHTLIGKCDFVMANPPFNVDLVDAERIKSDPRLPFGLPGVNKEKKVSNGNYLWISYFWSYLSEKGRAGFVMSSQASSAGHMEKEVRRKIIETGDVDVMISIRSNFFYTRSVPCELWFFDRDKPADRRDKILMLDARNVFRKVTRKINDFSSEQMRNLSAIIWLYRGQHNRFLTLVEDYFKSVCEEVEEIPGKLIVFDETMAELRKRFSDLSNILEKTDIIDKEKKQAFDDACEELYVSENLYETDRSKLLADLNGFHDRYAGALPRDNAAQHEDRRAFEPVAESVRGLVKQIDLLYKLVARVVDTIGDMLVTEIEEIKEAGGTNGTFNPRVLRRIVKQLDEERKAAVEQLKAAVYFYRQIVWLEERFPDAEFQAVPGLVKLVSLNDIETADWSLTPGRYVGVTPPEVDEDFDFEQSLRDIHVELTDLNKEAVELAAKIQENFAELGI
jgi:type I restriction enzyme M protein